jgi:catechol 2,3-dioxygenase-like lactoylglutathione lyase family enzyme
MMIHGVHVLLYSRDPEADRAFFRDVLNLGAVDAGGGWLIFGLPPAELGIHPDDGSVVQDHPDQSLTGCVVYLMCDNLRETIDSLSAKGIATTAIQEANWGSSSSVRLPSGGALGLYEPRHQTALHLAGS